MQNSAPLAYEVLGNPQDPAVMLVMGITGQLIAWPDQLVQDLAAAGFYVMRIDNRDVGLSPYYDHLPTPNIMEVIQLKQQGQMVSVPYGLEDMANDIRELMDHLKLEKVHLVGLSMGGQIAQVFALAYPNRLLSLSCLESTTGDADLSPPAPEVLNLFFGPKAEITDVESYVASRLQTLSVYLEPEDYAEAEAAARQLYLREYQRAYHPEGNMRQMLALIAAEPRGKKLANVSVPSVVIHGDADPVVNLEHGQRLADSLPTANLVVIPGLGHGLPHSALQPIKMALLENFVRATS